MSPKELYWSADRARGHCFRRFSAMMEFLILGVKMFRDSETELEASNPDYAVMKKNLPFPWKFVNESIEDTVVRMSAVGAMMCLEQTIPETCGTLQLTDPNLPTWKTYYKDAVRKDMIEKMQARPDVPPTKLPERVFFRRYLSMTRYPGFIDDEAWTKLDRLACVRNCIVHRGGDVKLVPGSEKAAATFNIDVDGEDQLVVTIEHAKTLLRFAESIPTSLYFGIMRETGFDPKSFE